MAVQLKDEYKKEEIDRLTDEQLEELAKRLPWPKASRYSYRTNLAGYRTTGFPRSFGNAIITSRRQFLRKRLKQSEKARINPEKLKAIQKKKEAEYEKQPKVKVSAKTKIVIELKDARPKGHTFIVSRENGKIKATQKQDTKASVGRRVCTQEGCWNAEDFEAAIEFAKEMATSKLAASKTKGKASLNVDVSVMLRGVSNDRYGGGGVSLYFLGEGNKVYVSQTRIPNSGKRTDAWCFAIKDLETVISSLKKKYTAQEVKS